MEKDENKIKMVISHVDGDREIFLVAKDMKELIDVKIPEYLPTYVPKIEDDLTMLKLTERFKKDPEGEEKKERESGWYYDC